MVWHIPILVINQATTVPNGPGGSSEKQQMYCVHIVKTPLEYNLLLAVVIFMNLLAFSHLLHAYPLVT